MGYFIYVLAVMFLIPSICVVVDFFIIKKENQFINALGKWFIFWMIGIRLLTAGLKQVFDPAFTASMLNLDSTGFVIIQELGFANVLFGLLAIISLFVTKFRLSATIGGFYLGMAGILHVTRIGEEVSFKETVAMVSDLFALMIVLIYCIGLWINRKEEIKL